MEQHQDRKAKSALSEAMHYKCVSVIRKFVAYHLNQIFSCCKAYDNQDSDNFTESSARAPCLPLRELAGDSAKPNHRSDTRQSEGTIRALLCLLPKIALLKIITSHISACKSLPWHTKQHQIA